MDGMEACLGLRLAGLTLGCGKLRKGRVGLFGIGFMIENGLVSFVFYDLGS